MGNRLFTVLSVVLLGFQASAFEAFAGQMYDMSIFLSEPHPFEAAAKAKARVTPVGSPNPPITTGTYPQPQYGQPTLSQSVEEGEDDSGVWRLEAQNEEPFDLNIFEGPMYSRFGKKTESGHLTWGLRVSYTPNASDPEWLERYRDDLLWPQDVWKVRTSYSLQQSAYTPNTYSAERGVGDRPGAGYLLANARFNLERDFNGSSQYLDRINLGLGIVGPASGASVTHRITHSAIGRTSRSWNEIKSEPVAIAQYDTGKRWVWGEDYLSIEAYPNAGVTLGNALTYASVGFSTRIGSHLKKDSGPLRANMIMSGTNFPQTGDYFAWNMYAGIEGRYIGYNIFVDGNTYTNTSNVDSKRRVVDVQLGAELGWGEKRLSLVHVLRSREFQGQIREDQFVRLGLSADFSKANFEMPKLKDGPLWGVISEVRLGALSHDAVFPSRHKAHFPNPFDNRYEGGVNINPEVVFISPDMLDVIGAPRPHIGISANVGDDTNSAYTGLGWDTKWDNDIFLEGFFGLAVHDGKLTDGNPDKIEFGSQALFRLGGELGWRWDGANGISFIWEHMSNAGFLDDKNQGMDSMGLRYSYRFD